MAQDAATEELVIDRIATAPEDIDVEVIDDKSLPAVLLDHREENPDDIALRWKRYGVWQEYTWTEYFERVRDITHGLEDLGFRSDDILFTIGYNRPHQVWAWLAAQSLGGCAAPNYEEMLPRELATQIQQMEPRIAYAEDQEMVDKLLAVEDSTIETIIYRDPKGMFRYEDREDPRVVSYEAVEARGRERHEAGRVTDEELMDRIRSLDPHSSAMLSPTSGTTGTPKRVQISHFNFLNQAQVVTAIDPLPEESDHFSYLPLAWVGEQMILMAAAFVAGWTANFPEEPETEQADLREIGPEIIFSSPRTWEGWVADIKARIENTTWLKRVVYDAALSIGERYADYVSGDKMDEDPPVSLRAAHRLAYWLVYRPILDKIGLKRAKNVYTGGGPLGEEHLRYYHALSVPLKQIWGQSEVSGIVTIHRDDDIQVETVGEVLPNIEVGVSSAGELLVRGPVVTSGYYNQPEKTAETIEDGWLHTDDFGDITEDGHVKVFDRMDDVYELTDGTAIAPVSIETDLKFNPYIKEVMVAGDGRDELTAICNIRYENVAEWADQRDLQYSGYAELSQHPAVLELLRREVAEVNDTLETKISRFVVLFKEFNADDGELTRTGKVRREEVTNRYHSLIEGLYNGQEEIEMDVTITYQDGREAQTHGTMTVVDAETPVAQAGDIHG